MKSNQQNQKLIAMRGFLILIFGVIFFTTGNVVKQRSGKKGITAMQGVGIAAMVVGGGLQIWDVARRKSKAIAIGFGSH